MNQESLSKQMGPPLFLPINTLIGLSVSKPAQLFLKHRYPRYFTVVIIIGGTFYFFRLAWSMPIVRAYRPSAISSYPAGIVTRPCPVGGMFGPVPTQRIAVPMAVTSIHSLLCKNSTLMSTPITPSAPN